MYGEFFVVKLGKTKIWGRSYTTIPITVRKILELENGDSLEWSFIDGTIVIKKKSPDQDEKVR